ncbi:hypothetical protein [Azospirillum argentinense]
MGWWSGGRAKRRNASPAFRLRQISKLVTWLPPSLVVRQLLKGNQVTMPPLIATQCRMARAALQLGVREVATLAKVSPNTIARLERGENLQERTLQDIRRAFEDAGVIFLADGEAVGGGPGVRLRKEG